MSNASPFETSTFEALSNSTKSATIHGDLTLQLALWSFGSPTGLPLPKWELPWECECALPHTPSHFLRLPGVCDDSRASSWPAHFQCLCLCSRASFLWTLGIPSFGLSGFLPLDSRASFLLTPATLQPLALVASPKLGLRQHLGVRRVLTHATTQQRRRSWTTMISDRLLTPTMLTWSMKWLMVAAIKGSSESTLPTTISGQDRNFAQTNLRNTCNSNTQSGGKSTTSSGKFILNR